MTASFHASSESDRLRALAELQVLDSAPEPEFDALVQAAALVCGTPISLISLVDAERQWFKAGVGLPGVSQTPRDQAFCAHAIREGGLMEVADATADERFRANPLVIGDPRIRFYAGAPLRLRGGEVVGTLCVIDREPRVLDERQRAILAHLAEAAVLALERRRAAHALIESEDRFRELAAAAPLGIFATDAQGLCTYTNPRWQEIYGLSLRDSLGHGWVRPLHPDDAAAVAEAWQRAATQGEVGALGFRIVRSDGSVRHVRAVTRPVRGADGQVLSHVGSIEDITEQLAAQQALADQNLRLNAIIEATRTGTWEYNVRTGELRVNATWAAVLGYTPQELGPMRIDLRISHAHPDELAMTRQLLKRHFAGESSHYEGEFRLRHRDGRWIWVHDRGQLRTRTADGRPEWMFGTHRDITERVAQREALRASLERMALATHAGGIGVWELTPRSGALQWDAQMSQLFGHPPQALQSVPVDWQRQVHRDDLPALRQALSDTLAGRSALDTEFRVVWPDGSIRHLRAAARISPRVDMHEQALPPALVGVSWDVTESRRLAAELADQHELLRVTLRSIGDAVITTDALGHITWLNPAAERLTGWTMADARGRLSAQVFHILNESTRAPAPNPVDQCLEQGTVVALANNTLLVSRSGAEYGIEDSAAPIRDDQGHVLGAVLVFHDVTEQRRLSGEMSYRATHDVLTGLVNRMEAENRLRALLNKSQEDGSAHALMFLDLDQFKLVNDACGHSAGDQLLQQVSRLLREQLRGRDTVARLGGDEFAVILEHCSAEQAARVAQKLCQRMDDYRFVHDERRFRIGVSIGLVPVDRRWLNTAAVMKAADSACFAAKEAGRNRVHVWADSDLGLQTRRGDMQWATRLEHALDDDRFVLFAQRIVPLQPDPEPGVRAELLLRLVDTDGSLVMPGAFLPAAERFNLAQRIDRWVLRRVLALLGQAACRAATHTLGINLSGQSIGDRAFHRHAIELLGQAGPAVCQRLCLEITETAAVTNMADAALFIEQVRGLGVRVALDDFGAGASSFGYLKTLKVDVLKIDGQFIRNLVSDPLDEAAVRCFVDVARLVGMGTVAEFVDQAAVLDKVRALGIHHAQGYLLHKPEPIGQLLRLPALDEHQAQAQPSLAG